MIPGDVPKELVGAASPDDDEGNGADGADEDSKVIRYRSSPNILRIACRVCGASLANVERGGEWEVATGCVEFVDSAAGGSGSGHEDTDRAKDETNKTGLQGRFNRVQLWVDDVKGDAGAAAWINRGELHGMDRRWRGRDSDVVEDEHIVEMLGRGRGRDKDRQQGATGDREGEGEIADDEKRTAVPPPSGRGEKKGDQDKTQVQSKDKPNNENDTLHARCHCGQVSFAIFRPPTTHNKNTGKFNASLDACTSCRLVSGFEITSWATIPRSLIETPASSLEAYLADTDTDRSSYAPALLTRYQTSQHVDRYFCSCCAATVFYYRHGLDTLDVGVGLLEDESEGRTRSEGRVEHWLQWEQMPGALGYMEDAVDAEFVNGIAEGLRRDRGEIVEEKK